MGRSSIHFDGSKSYISSTSKGMCIIFIEAIIAHRPSFTIAHNGYGFDNRVLCYHLSSTPYAKYFVSINTKETSKMKSDGNGFKFRMDIPGVNNLCSLVYLKTAFSTKYHSFKLSSLAISLGLKLKTNPPAFEMTNNDEE